MSADLAADFERQYQRDQQWIKVLNAVAWIVTVVSLSVLLVILFGYERQTPELVALTLYPALTRGSMLLASKAVLFPPFTVHLDDSDPVRAAAARRVFERHRREIAPRILAEQLEPADRDAVEALGIERVAALAREHDIDGWRRWGTRWLIGWCILSVALCAALLLGGGSEYD